MGPKNIPILFRPAVDGGLEAVRDGKAIGWVQTMDDGPRREQGKKTETGVQTHTKSGN